MINEKADAIRKKYHYRRLILTGKIALAHQVKLIGPDTAYHPYAKPRKNESRT